MLLSDIICISFLFIFSWISCADGFGLISGSRRHNFLHSIRMHNHFCHGLTEKATTRTTRTTGTTRTTTLGTTTISACFSKKKDEEQGGNNDEDSWDENFDYEKEWPKESSSSPDPSTAWNTPLGSSGLEDLINADGTPKLGIDIGSQLKPLTEKEAAELKAEATELINEAVAAGIDDIERLRSDMKKQIEKSKKTMELSSDLNLQVEKSKLMDKIDQLTGDFLSSTENSRESTKLAAKADQAMEGKGLDLGTWGILGGAAVVAGEGGTLLGSVTAAAAAAAAEAAAAADKESAANDDYMMRSIRAATVDAKSQEESVTTRTENRLMIVADTSQDKMAKLIVPGFIDKLEEAIPGIIVRVVKPTETMPLGADDSACVVVFCTSLSDKNSLKNLLDRALRRTLKGGGQMGQPPTQIVGVSTVGTERYNKMPYSMQNLMSGGSLEKRRQMEEAIIRTVQQRVITPPLDYTICKFGDVQENKNNFQLLPGDALDGSTSIDTAVNVLLQAVAYQPAARNATLCAIGSIPSSTAALSFWDQTFLPLDGPEIARYEGLGDPSLWFVELVEYINEWSDLLASTGKGLTTPIMVQPSTIPSIPPNDKYPGGVQQRVGVKLLYLPTATGKNYLSKEEELRREQQQQEQSTSYQRSSSLSSSKKIGKDGGIEILIEVTNMTAEEDQLRIRAKRCNYADDVPIKEITEETIIKRLQKAIDTWVSTKKSNR